MINQGTLKLSIHHCEAKKVMEENRKSYCRPESRNCIIIYFSRIIYEVMKNAVGKVWPSVNRFLLNSRLVDFL